MTFLSFPQAVPVIKVTAGEGSQSDCVESIQQYILIHTVLGISCLFTKLEPLGDVADKAVGDTNFHAFFDKEFWFYKIIDLSKTERVFRRHITRFPDILPVKRGPVNSRL